MDHTLSGNFRFHTEFSSRFLKPTRDIVVYLPPGYDEEKGRRYPVCYLHDGQNLFDAATAFLGNEWGVDEAAEELIGTGRMEPVILVGIHNAGMKRIGEYTPVRDWRGRGGKARAYGKMIVRELKPQIDREYRTLPDSQNTGLGGSSLGGLVTMYLGLLYPDVFGKLLVMSPSVWWASGNIIKQVSSLRQKPEQRIWLDIGTAEGSNPDATVRDVEALGQALVSKGWQLGQDLRLVVDQDAGHNEAAWGHRIRDAFPFLFPPCSDGHC